jgi:hypothetical protein
MSDSYELENNAIDGEYEMGSLNHSTVSSTYFSISYEYLTT